MCTYIYIYTRTYVCMHAYIPGRLSISLRPCQDLESEAQLWHQRKLAALKKLLQELWGGTGSPAPAHPGSFNAPFCEEYGGSRGAGLRARSSLKCLRCARPFEKARSDRERSHRSGGSVLHLEDGDQQATILDVRHCARAALTAGPKNAVVLERSLQGIAAAEVADHSLNRLETLG